MYNRFIFQAHDNICGNPVYLICFPDFREHVTIKIGDTERRKGLYYSNAGAPRFENIQYKRSSNSQEQLVYAPENATWFITESIFGEYKSYNVYVTPKTRYINSPLGTEFNKGLNNMLKIAKKKYQREKDSELRLYYWSGQLNLVSVNNFCTFPYYYEKECTVYKLDRFGTKPEQKAFIIGRVSGTTGTKSGNLLDFIVPVYQIPINCSILNEIEEKFELSYDENVKRTVEHRILELLSFMVSKEHDSIKSKRAIASVQKIYPGITDEEAISIFANQIRDCFKSSDAIEIFKLSEAFYTPLDCSKERFWIRNENSNPSYLYISFSAEDLLTIEYYNGEVEQVSIKWIHENQDRLEHVKVIRHYINSDQIRKNDYYHFEVRY